MTYRAGVGMRAAAYGIEPGEPRFTCDGCGLVVSCVTRYGLPKAFLRNGKPPPGWKAYPKTEFTSWHLCKACKVKLAPSSGDSIAPTACCVCRGRGRVHVRRTNYSTGLSSVAEVSCALCAPPSAEPREEEPCDCGDLQCLECSNRAAARASAEPREGENDGKAE